MSLPRLTYDTGPAVNLDWTVEPWNQETFPTATTFIEHVPQPLIGDTDETVANHIYMFDFVEITTQAIDESVIDNWWSWWAVVYDGQEFTYYPDKDVGGTSNTVVHDMPGGFRPIQVIGGLYNFIIRLRVIA